MGNQIICDVSNVFHGNAATILALFFVKAVRLCINIVMPCKERNGSEIRIKPVVQLLFIIIFSRGYCTDKIKPILTRVGKLSFLQWGRHE